ncbi:pyridoxamine kinase [Streptococcus phocae subsp. phocae]
MLKRVIVANDIVGVGKAALSASIPIMAACQVEQAILPTCLLSRHTGGNRLPYRQHFSKGLLNFLNDWESAQINFDGFFVGYLDQPGDALPIIDFIEKHKLPLVLDPIMADNGKLYASLGLEHLQAMKTLAKKAQLILPNLTEACLLADYPLLKAPYTPQNIEGLLTALAKLGPQDIVLTGVSFSDNQIGFAHYSETSDQISYHMAQHYPHHFYGTGDVVSAIVTAGYMQGISIHKLLPLALEFLQQSLVTTLHLNRELSLGICFEPHLGDLITSFKTLLETSHDITKTC